ncbi:MAG TPA: hypothetical protein ENN45_02505, partial [Bacteroidetes bacterium]|nr:hypothetical protein [Bacteroidota bacterium]
MLKKGSSEIFIGLAAAIVGLALVFSFYLFSLDIRWLGVLLLAFIGIGVFQLIEEKEKLLLHMVFFLLPFTAGFMYSPLIVHDLFFGFDLIFFLLVTWWLIETHGFQTTGLYIHKSTVPGILMVFWGAVGVMFCVSRLSALLGTFLLFKAFLVYFYIINKIKFKYQLKIIMNMLLLGIGIQGLLGLLQKLVGHGLGLSFLGEKQVSYWESTSRVRGTLAVPNQYGAYMILLMPIAISFYISAKTKREKLWYGAIIMFSMFGLFFSLSRSSWFGLIGAILVMLFLLYREGQLKPSFLRGVVLISLVMVLFAVVFWDVIVLRFETGEQGEHRSTMIHVAFPIILSHPIFGVGKFNYQYHSFSSFEFWHPVHNTILRITAEMGFPGIILFLLFVGIIIKEALNNLKLRDKYLR